MRAQIDNRVRAVFRDDDNKQLTVTYTNRGDPYQEGVIFEMSDGGDRPIVYVELLDTEADRLLECLAKLRGKKLT